MEKLPKRECTICEHFQKKERLTKDNQIITKESCLKFHQELFSHQACPKFRYNNDIESEVDTIYGTIGAISGVVVLLSFIPLFISLIIKSDLMRDISIAINVLSIISLVTFMLISNKIEKRMLYGTPKP